MPAAIYALFVALLGDFDMDEVKQSNSFLGPLLAISFVVITVFCLLNMFLCIIIGAYEDVRQGLDESQDDPVTKFMREKLQRSFTSQLASLRKLFAKRLLLRNFTFATSSADQDNDGIITRDELDQLVAKFQDKDASQLMKLLGAASTSELIAKYDQDGDEGLDEEEMQALYKDLQRIEKLLDSEEKMLERGGDVEGAADDDVVVPVGVKKRRASRVLAG